MNGPLLNSLADSARAYLSQGGLIMLPLALAAFALWYVLGYRFSMLRRGSALELRALIDQARRGALTRARGFLDAAALQGLAAGQDDDPRRQRQALDAALRPLRQALGRGAVLARSIVVIAPLAGLLGTVSGMIEMFDSLAEQTFLSQTGGVARGIGEALFTTQLGLAIAIPGLLLSRFLERRQAGLADEIDQLTDILCSGRRPR